MGDILSKSSLIKDIELVVKDTHTNEKNNEVGKEKLKERTKTVLDEDFDHTDNKCVYNGRPNATAPAIEKTNFIPPSAGKCFIQLFVICFLLNMAIFMTNRLPDHQ